MTSTSKSYLHLSAYILLHREEGECVELSLARDQVEVSTPALSLRGRGDALTICHNTVLVVQLLNKGKDIYKNKANH